MEDIVVKGIERERAAVALATLAVSMVLAKEVDSSVGDIEKVVTSFCRAITALLEVQPEVAVALRRLGHSPDQAVTLDAMYARLGIGPEGTVG